METTKLLRVCSCCHSAIAPGPWRQRAAWMLSGQLFVYLCARCASRFANEAAITDFLESALDAAIARRNLRRAI
jgi:hypothetical protein